MNIENLFLEFALLGAEWVLWLLVALSILSVTVIVERLMFFQKRKIDTIDLMELAREAIETDSAALEKKFGDSESLAAVVAVRGVAAHAGGIASTAEAMNSAKARVRREYERYLVILGTLGNNAPFVGLFGTVLGIVGAFNKLKTNPDGGIDVVGGDLSEALVATAVGILVALPAVVAFNYFNRRLRSDLGTADEVAHVVLGKMHALADRDGGES